MSVWQPILLASTWPVPAAVAAIWGCFECLLGLLSLAFVGSRLLHRTLMILFGAFVGLLVSDWLMGATECQCLGGAGTPIWFMLGLDVGLLVAMFVQRDRWAQSHPLPTGFLGDVAWSARWVAPALLLLSVFVFGPPRSAIDYVRGQSILVAKPLQQEPCNKSQPTLP